MEIGDFASGISANASAAIKIAGSTIGTWSASGLNVTGTVTATEFVGGGGGLTGISISNVVYGSHASANTDAVYVDASDDVGIGTTSPTSPTGYQKILHIAGAAPALVLEDTGGGLDIYEIANSSGQLIIRNGTDAREELVFDGTGNVGIGTIDFGSGAGGVMGIVNATAPSGTPTGGGVLYVESGALKYKGSSGTITTLGVA